MQGSKFLVFLFPKTHMKNTLFVMITVLLSTMASCAFDPIEGNTLDQKETLMRW